MLDKVRQELHRWLIPSHRNGFHPHLIAERGAIIIFGLILCAEGFLVSNAISAQAGTPSLAAVAATPHFGSVLPALVAPAADVWFSRVIVPLLRVSALPDAGRTAFFTLVVLTAGLSGMLALTVGMRQRRYETVGYMTGGVMLAFAATLILFNTHVLLPRVAVARQMATAAVTRTPVATSAGVFPIPPVIFPVASSTGETPLAQPHKTQ